MGEGWGVGAGGGGEVVHTVQVGSALGCGCDPEDRVSREKMESSVHWYYLEVA